MKKKIIFYIAILSSVIYLTSCSNRKEFTCVDIDTNQNVNTSEILGQKMTAEIYSDNIKFTFPDDTETGYDSFTVKIVDEETVKVPNNPDIFSISVNWHFPYIHQACNIKKVFMRADFPNGKYVYLEYE